MNGRQWSSSIHHLTNWEGSLPRSMGHIRGCRRREFGDCTSTFYGLFRWGVEGRERGGIKVVQGRTSMGKQRKGGKSGGSCVSTWHTDMLAWLCPAPHHCCMSCLPIKFFPGYHGEGLSGEEGSLCSMHMCVLVGRLSPAIAVGPWFKGDRASVVPMTGDSMGGVCECVVTIKDQARQVASGWSGLGASACGYVSVSVTTEGIGYQRDDGILTSCWRDCRVWGTMCPSLHTYLCFCAGSKREEQGSRISNWTDCVSKASYWRDSQCMCV